METVQDLTLEIVNEVEVEMAKQCVDLCNS